MIDFKFAWDEPQSRGPRVDQRDSVEVLVLRNTSALLREIFAEELGDEGSY